MQFFLVGIPRSLLRVCQVLEKAVPEGAKLCIKLSACGGDRNFDFFFISSLLQFILVYCLREVIKFLIINSSLSGSITNPILPSFEIWVWIRSSGLI